MDETSMDQVLPELTYWNPRLLDNQFNQANAHRYICFDVDLGGLNNIRLVFEYVAVIAAVTGRTLVLPPPQPWYLLNNGPQHLGTKAGVTAFDEIFDIPALREVIPVQSTEDFIRESAEHLSIPATFQQEDAFTEGGGQDLWKQWKQWLFENAEVPKGWNPHETLICFPDIERTDVERLHDQYVDGRKLIEFTPWMNAAPVIYFPSDSEYRFLGPVATMLASADDELPRLTRRFIKHHIRYHPRIFTIASELISSLGLYQYTAVHIRRNDFQYKQTRTQAEETCNNIHELLSDDFPVYIATDEADDDFRDVFRLKRTVFFWDDLMQKYSGPDFPEKLIGPIEQLICVGANRFVGTDLSTFSSYIVRLRGYTRAPDMASYYHTERYTAPEAEPDLDHHKGRDYLRENPLYWLDC